MGKEVVIVMAVTQLLEQNWAHLHRWACVLLAVFATYVLECFVRY